MRSISVLTRSLMLAGALVLAACATEPVTGPKREPYVEPPASAATATIKGWFESHMPWTEDMGTYVAVVDEKALPHKEKARQPDPVRLEAGDRMVTIVHAWYGPGDVPGLLASVPVILKAVPGHTYIIKAEVRRDGFLGKSRAALIWIEDEADGTVVTPKSLHPMR
jgi:hypothetical protein